MKRLTKTLCALLCLFAGIQMADAQMLEAGQEQPSGVVIYSLPSTSIMLTVTAEKENFVAGPYAQFAQKYMGSEARTEDAVTYTLKSIDLAPYLEADPSTRIALNLSGKGTAAANFLQLCSQGLIVASDSYTGKPESWRFPSIANNDVFAGKDVEGNLTSATTTLYKTVNTAEGFQRVAVSQSQVVEKSLEKKAQETANTIFDLRKSRMQIITGDTDATYSGEAMQAAISEITRLEQEYMSLFYGTSTTSVQTMNFDVVPKASTSNQMYVAFRISDTEGLLPANDVAGRPIVLELSFDKAPSVSTAGISASRLTTGGTVYYRVPVIATARIMDGSQMLLQTRIPVYQFGQTVSFPLNSVLK
ncbi:MAG: DUF4831 family protein [Bacteroidales bacterium]|nr:DUF4831 family protein [Bacteroidales bacterium]